MKPFVDLTGIAAPLPLANVDTDQILPKQFLKTITREGLGKGLFYDFRVAPDGSRIADFVLNRDPWTGASILIAGENFGCGSSREHAPWALLDFGISCVIAPSFAEIFYNNCFNNGLLPIVLDASEVAELTREASETIEAFSISLPDQKVTAPSGAVMTFDIDPVRKNKLLNGLDAIGETLRHAADIDAFEARRLENRELV